MSVTKRAGTVGPEQDPMVHMNFIDFLNAVAEKHYQDTNLGKTRVYIRKWWPFRWCVSHIRAFSSEGHSCSSPPGALEQQACRGLVWRLTTSNQGRWM